MREQILLEVPYKDYATLRARLRSLNDVLQTASSYTDPVIKDVPTAIREQLSRLVTTPTQDTSNRVYYGIVVYIDNGKYYIDVPCDQVQDIELFVSNPTAFFKDKNNLTRFNSLIFNKNSESALENPVIFSIVQVHLDTNFPRSSTKNELISIVHNQPSILMNIDEASTNARPVISGGSQGNNTNQTNQVATNTTAASGQTKNVPSDMVISQADVVDRVKLKNFFEAKTSFGKVNNKKFNNKKLDTIRKILDLKNPHFASVISSFIKLCWSLGHYIFIDNGRRTYDEQANMFIIGRYTDEIIKYELIALPGFSAHGVGYSVDLHYYTQTNLQYSRDIKNYEKINKISQEYGFNFFWRGECERWTFGYDDRPEFVQKRKEYLSSLKVTDADAPIFFLKRALRRAKDNNKKFKQRVNANETSMKYAMRFINNNKWWPDFLKGLVNAR